tara:strand:+ start:283 stop:423 length:141 start_codon:yes stop_codon:yes gene_type:complete
MFGTEVLMFGTALFIINPLLSGFCFSIVKVFQNNKIVECLALEQAY